MTEQPGGTGPGKDGGDGAEAPDRTPDGAGPAGRPPLGGPPSKTDASGLRALLLGGLALVFALFFFPAGLILGIAAVVVGIRARRQAKGRRATAPGAAGGIVLGSIGLVVVVFSITVTALLWPQMSAYQDCLGAANTVSDEKACKTTYVHELEKKFGRPGLDLSRLEQWT
ncbi:MULTISPECIES: DUF4190 domain-containing protein [Thermomonosporaceae]|uniref:DUF4190 domain-containing protein n=1 Tax=Thermomonosporaceae TaxID=2012 RepID=UPI00255AD74A|nr:MULTISPECIES: DUF4190 domain-containing protein [Thermomonosporaceae]MDL4776172.1 DUF4190 domain-containing protein [Actinomadura xylanilytica]